MVLQENFPKYFDDTKVAAIWWEWKYKKNYLSGYL
jgi:hypothetical protein